jgi:hypothetical protein
MRLAPSPVKSMRPNSTLPLALLLACGPHAPPIEAASTTSASAATTDAPSPTTTDPSTTTVTTTTPATITDPTTIDISTSGSTSTGNDSFIVTPDGGVGGTIKCDVFAQDCPPGQKCAPWVQGGGGFWNALKCVDITGDGAPGEPCTVQESGGSGLDDCALGVFCWDVGEDLHGTCIAQCGGSPDTPTCPAKTSCSVTGDAIINLCLPNCEPLLQDCPGDDICAYFLGAFDCVDTSADAGQINDSCDFDDSCGKGLVCLEPASTSSACDPDATGCCTPFCQIPDAPCPNPDQQCLPLSPPPSLGFEDVGVCRLPG